MAVISAAISANASANNLYLAIAAKKNKGKNAQAKKSIIDQYQ
jgi:hypothetical protein